MCKIQMLRTLVKHRLDNAVEEIIELFENTIVEYEEELSRSKKENERQRDLLDAVLNPQVRLDRAEVQDQQALVTTQDVHVKEEEEEEDIQSRQVEADVTKGTSTLVFVKSEDNTVVLSHLHHSELVQQALVTSQDVQVKEEEDMQSGQDVEADVFVKSEDNEAQFSQLHHNEENRDSSSSQHSGASQPDNSAPPSDLDDSMSHHSDADHGADTNMTHVSSNGDISPTISSERGETLVHKSDKKPFKCPLCDKGFSREIYMMAHKKAHAGGKPFTCSVCAKSYVSKSQLRTHIRSHTGERPFTCSVCAKCFLSNAQLKIHTRIHTGERPFTCSECSKCFIISAHLQAHSRIHTGERPFSCKVCNKSYARKSHMESHMLTHTQTGEKPFDCSVCGKSFSTKKYLMCHMKRHSERKRYTCPVCSKNFANKAYIVIHMTTHTGEKLFSCDTCSEKFTFRSQVKSHVCTGNK